MSRILDKVVGHSEQIRDLLRAIEVGQFPSTALFVGPSGVGKKQVALGLAQALVCEREKSGCGTCPSCIRLEKQQSESLAFVEPSGVQIKIDQAREVMRFLSFKSLSAARVVIIDQAHLLNTQAANALLKSLEEPPEGTHFILIANNLASMLATIRSRSQVVSFSPLTESELRQVHTAEDWMISSSQGSLEKLNQIMGEDWAASRNHCFEFVESILSENREKGFALIKELASDKETALFSTSCLLTFFRDAVLANIGEKKWMNRDQSQKIMELSESPRETLIQSAEKLVTMERGIRQNQDRTLLFEDFWIACRRLRPHIEY